MNTPSMNRYKNHRFPAEIISHGVWLYFRFCLSYRGQRHYLWRAVDQDGTVLDILVQRCRAKAAAKKFFRKLLKGCQCVPRVIITDKLKSYGAAKREILPGVEHRQHRYLNNRAEGIVNLSSSHRVWHTRRMNTSVPTNRYKNHRFPAEIISHGVWLYYRFCLSYRDVEELLFTRGIHVTYEAIRKWCRKFGQAYANQLRHRRPHPGDKWHLDEVFLTINGDRHYLWRAVDQDGNVLDVLVQRHRSKTAAKKFFRKLLKGCQYVPRVLITDKLKSYGAAKRELLPSAEHRQHRYLNNRAENSHQPTRQRERRMQGFKSPGHAQRFLSAYGPIAQHFRPRRHRLSALEYRQEMGQRFHTWQDMTSLPTAA